MSSGYCSSEYMEVDQTAEFVPGLPCLVRSRPRLSQFELRTKNYGGRC